ncbi:MAG: T9SS type A sorting domain-containing protein, partial [Bacteroidota bacterium]
ANNSRLITSVISGTYYSDNYGQNWVLSSGSSQFIAICKQGSLIFSIGFSDIYKSADNGQTWIISSNNGFNATDLTIMKKIYNINNVLIIGCNSISVYTSSDSGQNWLLASTGITGTPQAGGIYYFNNLVYKKTSNGYFVLNETTGLWSQSNITQTNDIGILGYNTGRYFGVNSILYDGLVYTDNNGLTWQNCNGVKCMNIRKLSSSENLYSLYDAGGYLFDSTQTIFNRTTPFNQNYSANTYFQSGVFDIKKRSNGTIYLATAGGVWKSTNNGASYTQSYNGLPQTGTVITVYQVNDLFVSGTFPNDTLFAATDNGIYFSTNDAQSFTLCAGTNGAKMQQFLKYDNVLYCAGTKIYKRTSPNNWTQFTTFTNTGILGFAATDGYLFVSVANSPLKYAPINGLSNFTNIVTGTGNFAYSVAAYDTLVFYFSNNGVFKLNTTLLGNATQSDLLQIADNLPYYNNPGNIRQYKYLDNGFGMSIFNGKLWLGTKGMSTFYRSLADFGYDITVGEKAPNNEKIKNSGVVFPNPTKDKLTITDLAQGSQLTIYNSIGQLVVQLSNSQSQTIDISKLEKGIYTYSIITDNKQNEISSGKFIKE